MVFPYFHARALGRIDKSGHWRGDRETNEVLKDFETKYNVKVTYDNYANNEDLLAKIKAGGSGYDLIQPSDYMVKTMIETELPIGTWRQYSHLS